MLIFTILNCYVLLMITLVNSQNVDKTNVHLDSSLIEGYMYNDKIIAYPGIPYAQPPINQLRFEPPQNIQLNNTQGVFNKRSKENVMCTQININGYADVIGEEDCLYLNIYVPTKEKGAKFSTMLYIHGGGFTWGTGVIYKPDYLLRDENVILVTINYRLGPLGFLAAGVAGHKIYANNGLKDQAMAIQWVYDNIEHFSGDNTKITIFGNSAGAASAHLHLFSPKSKGLFHAVILESGAANCHWAVQTYQNTVKFSAEYSRIVDCPVLPTDDMLTCLKQKNLNELVMATKKFNIFEIDPMILFLPTVEPYHDDAFLLNFPVNHLAKKDFYDVPMLLGTTPDEGGFRSAIFAKHPSSISKFDKYFHELYKITTLRYDASVQHIKSVRKFYFGEGDIDLHDMKPLTDFYTDEFFRCTDDTITLHYKYGTSPIYSYLFDYEGALTFSKVYANDENVDLGVTHMDETLYLFPLEFYFSNFKNSAKSFAGNDTNMSLFMTKLWTYFANNHNFDNFNNIGNELKWNKVQTTNNEHLIIDQHFKFQMSQDRFKDANIFWKKCHEDENQVSVCG